MTILLLGILAFAALFMPSRDHVRESISLDDRGKFICTASQVDGRKSLIDSAYRIDSDQNIKSSEAVLNCQAKIIGLNTRSEKVELLLNRLDPLANHIASQIQKQPTKAAALWSLSVFYLDPKIQAKILSILKTRLSEHNIPLRQQVPLSQLIDFSASNLAERCKEISFSDPTKSHLFVIQVQPPATALMAATCTPGGWQWL